MDRGGRMVKILQLCAVDFTAYHLLKPLAIEFRRGGYDVTFCCSPGERLDRLKEEGFNVEAVPISRSFNIFAHIISLARLVRLMRRNRYDVVHTHTPVAGLIGRLAARISGVPLVVYTAHGFYFHEDMRGIARRIFIAVERLGGLLCDLIFVQSGEDWKEALAEKIAPAEKLVHIGNGVDPAEFGKGLHAVESARIGEEMGCADRPVVGFVGRIVREKGAVEFVKAAALVKKEFPESFFIMVGATLGSDRDGCQAEIELLSARAGLDRSLLMTGYREDVPPILSLFDVMAMPSYREGMPRALLEAMATGLPVVASDIRGCREEVVDGETGILVPPRDHEKLAEALIRILRDPGSAAVMGEAGRARVLENFDERKITAMQVSLVSRMLRG